MWAYSSGRISSTDGSRLFNCRFVLGPFLFFFGTTIIKDFGGFDLEWYSSIGKESYFTLESVAKTSNEKTAVVHIILRDSIMEKDQLS